MRRILYLVLAVGIAAGFISLGSALFTDTANVGANEFTTGTVDISTDPATTVVSFDNMAPGDAVAAPIIVSNDGTLELRYAITSTADNDDTFGLNAQLVLTIKTGVTACTLEGWATDGTDLYTGDLGTAEGGNIIGNPIAGDDVGDRAVLSLEGETLCFHVSLPSDSGNAYQGATTTATFAFVAEQTKNND